MSSGNLLELYDKYFGVGQWRKDMAIDPMTTESVEETERYSVGTDTNFISSARVFDEGRQMDCNEIVDALNASHKGKSPDKDRTTEERIADLTDELIILESEQSGFSVDINFQIYPEGEAPDSFDASKIVTEKVSIIDISKEQFEKWANVAKAMEKSTDQHINGLAQQLNNTFLTYASMSITANNIHHVMEFIDEKNLGDDFQMWLNGPLSTALTKGNN